MDGDRFIIFLDVDGVICSYSKNIMTGGSVEFDEDGEHLFLESAVLALNAIIVYYDADLCMISSWNSKFRDEQHYKEFLTRRGIIVNNLYIGESNGNRAEWVLDQVRKHGIKHYLIIDDEAYAYYERMQELEYKRILRPDRNRCLDMYDFAHVAHNYKLNV